ncbi:MAG: tetratricopeptide repeat protein [Verrucomicrobia bacterium]|nr:tetratricopeptide repeat protein [Verrucomicrobiota bacterium]
MSTPQLRSARCLALAVAWLVSSCATPHGGSSSKVDADGRIAQDGNLGVLTDEQTNRAMVLAHYGAAEVHRYRREENAVIEEWEKVVALDPNRGEVIEKLVQEYFRRNDFAKAATLLESVVRRNSESAVYWMLLSVAYRQDKQWEKAREAAERAIGLDPSRFPAFAVLFEVAIELQDPVKARKVLDRAASQKTGDSEYWLRLAELYRALGARDGKLALDNESLVRLYDRAIALQPSDMTVLARIAEFFVTHNNLPKAIELYQRILEQLPHAEEIRLKLANCYVVQGNRNRAIEVLKQLVGNEPSQFQILTLIGDLYADLKDIEQALAHYRLSLNRNPNQLTPHIRIAVLKLKNNQPKEALKELETAREKFPNAPEVFTRLGETFEDLKDPTQALVNYRLSLEADPNQLPLHLKIALLEIRNKRTQEALSQLAVAREKFPNAPQVSYFYGLAYSEMKEYLRAIEAFEESSRLALASNPEMLDDVFYFYYGAALERAGKFDVAIEQFNVALEKNPDYADAYNYLGFMYADKNMKLDEALRLIEKALDYEPENGAFLDSLGWVYFRQGKLDKALTCLQRAAKIIDNDSVIFDHLGDVYRKMGRQTEALQYYQKAVELDPKNKEATEKLDALRRTLPSAVPFPNPPAETPSTNPQ